MSYWDINPASVAAILESVQNLAENDLTTAVNGTGSQMEAAANVCTAPTGLKEGGEAPLVAAALGEWFSRHETDITALGEKIVNVATNTASAVQAYLEHDEESALEFQRAAR